MSTIPNNKYFQACSTGKTKVVAAFLDQGVDPDARDKYQLTGLMWAGRKGRMEIAELLIGNGADIEAGDVRGRTALFHAACYKQYAFVQHLAKLGANVSPVDTHGCTPLDIATSGPDPKMVALLERVGADQRSGESGSERTGISIGLQSEGLDPLGWPKVHLYHMLQKHCTAGYCPAISEFALVLRCSSPAGEFGPAAIERIRRRRAKRSITVDIVVPFASWHHKSERQIKKYLAGRVRQALEICAARLKKDREQVDEAALLADVDAAIADFLGSPTPHQPWA
jgi:ankyrin repeat protein